jgi:hypothetical protein
MGPIRHDPRPEEPSIARRGPEFRVTEVDVSDLSMTRLLMIKAIAGISARRLAPFTMPPIAERRRQQRT